MKIIGKKDFEAFVEHLVQEDPREVVGVQEKGDKFVFDVLQKASDLRLDHDLTVLPPTQYFMSKRDILLQSDQRDEVITEDITPRIIIGIHPYDLDAIRQVDNILSKTPKGRMYLKKRKSSVLVGVNIINTSVRGFVGSMGTSTVSRSYDLMITDLGDEYAIEIGSEKGFDLLDGIDIRDATEDEKSKVAYILSGLDHRFHKRLNFPIDELPHILKQNHDNTEFWKKHSKECVECGSCVIVCPTSYALNADDITMENLSTTEQPNIWKQYLHDEYPKDIAYEEVMDENYQRYRHRLITKGLYLYEIFGDIACVGCGRCGSQCPTDVGDPSVVFNDL